MPLKSICLSRAPTNVYLFFSDLLCERQQKIVLYPTEESNNRINKSRGQRGKEEAVAWQDGLKHASPLKGKAPLWLTKIRLTLRPPWLKHLITFAYERPKQITYTSHATHTTIWWSPHLLVQTSGQISNTQ